MSPMIAYLLFLPADILLRQGVHAPVEATAPNRQELASQSFSAGESGSAAPFAEGKPTHNMFPGNLPVVSKPRERSLGDTRPIRKLSAEPSATLWRADDGLFYVDALINGATVKLIVDTGASMTVLSPDDARRVGVDSAAAALYVAAETAAGSSPMMRVTLANMQVGETSASSVSAVVASQELGFSLLGQNWLSRLASVTIEGDRMTLR